ncbi:hypothetical protein FGO68_gene8649 [Halteria grandinella]|uniref:Uncharacterized protein n=1 Tax=Halteria grandinella TaxID=5974 RepID=A0A8J8NY35_HALGN|nr:hypothetical protein FGO68_gene8649 [Halteria grandinella]
MVRYKPQQILPQFRKNLQLSLIHELQFDQVTKGTFVLARTACDSHKLTSVCTIIEDPRQTPFRLCIYNSKFNTIPAGQWMAIKEPFKKLAQDGQNVMLVDDPNDFEFIDERELLKTHDSNHLVCILKRLNAEQHQIVIVTLIPAVIAIGSYICLENQQKQLVKAKVKEVSHQFTDFWGNKQETMLISKLTLHEDSDAKLLVGLRHHHENTPGSFINLWNPEQFDAMTLLREKLRLNKYPICLAENLKHVWESVAQDSVLPLEEEVEIFWKENMALVNQLFSDFQSYRKTPSQAKEESQSIFNAASVLAYELDQLIQTFRAQFDEQLLEQQILAQNILLPPESFSLSSGSGITTLKKGQILPQAAVEDTCSQICFNSYKAAQKLINEKNPAKRDLALSVMIQWRNHLESEEAADYVNLDKFIQYLHKELVVTSKQDINSLEEALGLLSLDGRLLAIDEAYRLKKKAKAQKKKQKQKNKKKQANINVEAQDIEFIQEPNAIYAIIQEFSDTLASLEEEKTSVGSIQSTSLSSQVFDSESDSMSDCLSAASGKKSIISFLTVHSRVDGQLTNAHWKDRFLQRGKNVPEQDFDDLLKELKESLMLNNIQQSKVDPTRYLVRGSFDLRYVLQKTDSTTDGKVVYVPITVLGPQMRFK